MMAQSAIFSKAETLAFKKNVAAASGDIQNLQANFKQSKFMGTMKDPVLSSGTIYYSAPSNLRWSYTSPYSYELLFKDSNLFIIENGKSNKVNHGASDLFEKMGELVAGSFNGRILEMDELFQTKFVEEGKHVKAIVIPRDENLAEMFSEIWVYFNEQQRIEKVKLMESGGDYTTLSMSNLKINQKMPAAVFQQ